MPTIQQIEADLISYAQAGDLVNFTSTVNSVAASQKSQLDPLQIGQALDILASLTTQAPADVAAAASHFMARLGAFTDVGALGTALDDFGQANNYDGMKAIIDHLGDTQKPQLATVVLDNALNDIVFPNVATDPAVTNAALQDYMTHLGAYTDAFTLGQAMSLTAESGNLAGAEIIIDHIGASQKPLLDTFALDNTLTAIASPYEIPLDPSVSNPILLDFMTHLGAYTDPAALGQAMAQSAEIGNLAGADIIIDHVDAAQKPLLDPFTLGNTLNAIANPYEIALDPAAANPVLLDFMTHLGAYTDPFALGQAMAGTAGTGNLAGADIIIDHIDAAQKPLLDTFSLDNTLNSIAAPFNFPLDPPVANPVLLDFMAHLGAYTDPFGLEQAMAGTAGTGNLAGADIIIDHIDAAQKPLLDTFALDNTLNSITNPFNFPLDPAVANPVLLDFMTQLGAYTDPFGLQQAMAGTAEIGNLAGTDIIIDHIDATQKPLLDAFALGNILSLIVNPFNFPFDPAVANPVLLDFMTHLGAYTDPSALGQNMAQAAGIGNLATADIIIDHIGAAQKTLLDPFALDNTLGAIVNPFNITFDPAVSNPVLLDFMTHLGAYTDAGSLGLAMFTLAQDGDLDGVKSIVDNITAAQKLQLDSSFALGQTLNTIIGSDAGDPAATAAAVQDFMTHLGAYTDAGSIGHALNFLAQEGNLAGVQAIVDNITAAQKPLLDPGFALGGTLTLITGGDAADPSGTDAAVQDFMAHLGAYTDPGALGLAMFTLAQDGDLAGVKAIVDNVTAAEKPLLGPEFALGITLDAIVGSDAGNPSGTDAAVQDFMIHLGAYTDPGSIGQAMSALAQEGDLAGAAAIIDNIGAAQKPLFDPLNALGFTLNAIVMNDVSNPSGTDAAVQDFMSHLGAYTDAGTVGVAMFTLAQDGDLAGVKAVVDNITTAEKLQLDSSFALGQTLNTIVGSDAGNPSGTDAAVQDFMIHLGAYTDPGSIGQAMSTLAQEGDLAGAEAIIDNIGAAQKPLFDPASALGNTLNAIVVNDLSNPSGTDAAVQDFMNHLGAYTDPGLIGLAMLTLADDGDLAGVKAIVDNVTAAQKPLLGSEFALGNALDTIVGGDAGNPSGTDAAVLDFMAHVGAYTDPGSIGQAMSALAQEGDLAGVQAIVDNITAAQKPLLDPAFALGNTLDALIGSDAGNPSGTDAAVLDFMTHLGAYTFAPAVGIAMSVLAQEGDLTGVQAIVDNIAAAQKPLLDPSFALGNTLDAIVGSDFSNPSGTDAAVQDFMTHLGAYTDSRSIGVAMTFLAQQGDLTGVEAIVDNVTEAQKPLLDSGFALGNTLDTIVGSDAGNPSATDAAIQDFMTHLGAYTDVQSIGLAMPFLAQAGDLAGLKAIVDNIDAAQKPLLDPDFALGSTLDAIVGNDAGNPSATAASADDFMAKLGAYTAGFAIENAVMTVGDIGDWQTAAEILGHLKATQVSALSPGFLSWMASNDVQLTTTHGATLTGIAGNSNTLVAHGSLETLNGDGVSDVLYGFGHGDVLNGGAGNEVLIGHGIETLNGGTGSNDFVLDGGGQTTVNNFTVAQNDVLDLRDVLAPTDYLATHISEFLQLVDTPAGTEILANPGGNAKPNGWVDIGLVANVHDTDIATLVATHHLVA